MVSGRTRPRSGYDVAHERLLAERRLVARLRFVALARVLLGE
jgi:hypothetical protein